MFKQELILLGLEPVCKVSERIKRRNSVINEPSHDPYIPRNNTLMFNCSTECLLIGLNSMTEVTSPTLFLKSCYIEVTKEDLYECETIRYNYFKNDDKLLFLSKNIPDKSYYVVDCLVYSDGGRVCHKKGDAASYAKLVDTGTIARPNETSILAQDEFLCEETQNKEVNCDLNPYVPYDSGLKLKDSIKFEDSVLLKTGTYIVELKPKCIEPLWCGYSGKISISRRQYSYSPPGGKIFRCYYAKKQQVCKEIADPSKLVYNKRGWLER